MKSVDYADFPEVADRVGLPFRAVLGLITGLFIIGNSLTDLRDIDLWWHVVAGRELLSGISPSAVGETWSFAPNPLPWTTSQWAAEILFAKLHEIAGWSGLAIFRVVTATATIGILALTTLRRRPAILAGFPYLLAASLVAFASQERPQQATFIGAAALGGVLTNALIRGTLPRWWLVAATTTIWANLHGGWILMPIVLGIIAAAVLVRGKPRQRLVRRSAGLALLSLAAGAFTPSGLSGITAPLRFSEAAVLVGEWKAVTPTSELGSLSLLMLLLFLIGWSKSRQIPRDELVAVCALFTFSWLAWRNLTPGMLLLAPLAAHRLCVAFPNVGRPEPRWSTPAGVALASLLCLGAVGNVALKDNLPSTDLPLTLASRIAEMEPGQRVLNDYNVSGLVIFLGGKATKVGIDGRTDRYGAGYIKSYTELLSLRGDWATLLDALDPTVALVEADAPIAHVLRTERGWVQIGSEESGFVLLASGPGNSRASTTHEVTRTSG